MKNSELDVLVFKAITTIEKHEDIAFKPKTRTIASFLKGAEKSPFYTYFVKYNDVCGKANVSTKLVEESCLRLCDRNLIAKCVNERKATFFVTKIATNFIDQCTRSEQELLEEINNYICEKYPFINSADKKNRFAFYDSRTKDSGEFQYAWMWFTLKDMELIFRYKLSPDDNDKTYYEGNQITVNEFHKKTIINLIDLILKNNT